MSEVIKGAPIITDRIVVTTLKCKENAMIDDNIYVLTCPFCDYTIKQTVQWFEEHPSFRCPKCGETIDVDSYILVREAGSDD